MVAEAHVPLDLAVRAPDLLILSEVNQSLKDWFGRQRKSVVVLRPDKFVAAATLPTSLAQRACRRSVVAGMGVVI
jgi:hypothetical protein